MTRALITLTQEDKRWLHQQALLYHLSMAEVVRRAIHYYRIHQKPKQLSSLEILLEKTAGTWKKGDSVRYVKKLRKEWER